ncbi:MAG: outer membrane beta-barrel protein [Pseudomonadota bacterium]
MKKLITTSLAFFSLTFISNTAFAQSNFDGFYAGFGVGHARGTDKGIEYKDNGGSFYGATQRTTPEGNLFSVFGGFNQVIEKNILLGAETDYEKRNYSHAGFQEINNSPPDLYPLETKVKNAKSLRARFGYIFNQDKTLSYITAGFAKINITRTYGDLTNALGNGTSLSKNTSHNGYVFGLGIEHFLTTQISLRGEYRYTKYMAKNIDSSAIYASGTIEKQRFSDQSFRLGMAYNF